MRLSARVLVRLEQAEATEPNPHYRDDIRVAWITALNAARGVSQPHVAATYSVLGLHPLNVWPAIVERRKAELGALYEEFFGGSLPPKKPVQSVQAFEVVRRERTACPEWRPKKQAARNLQNSAPLYSVSSARDGSFNSESISQSGPCEK